MQFCTLHANVVWQLMCRVCQSAVCSLLAEHRLTAEQALLHQFLSLGTVAAEVEDCRQLAAWTVSAQAASKQHRCRS